MAKLYIWTSLCLILETFCQSLTDQNRFLGGENIALGKRTLQSSNYIEDNFTFSSNLSVDGNVDSDFSHKSCSRTDPKGPWPAWWSVDLGEERIVKRIVIFSRKGYTHRLSGARVLGFTNNGRQIEIDRTANYNQDIITIEAMIGELLRNVTIVLGYSFHTNNPINICEVEIYADLNIARRKPAVQTSTYSVYTADLAVDGNSSGDFDNGKSCTATQPETQQHTSIPSWSVTLEGEYYVSYIKIFNRNNDDDHKYTQRLGHFSLIASTRDNSTITLYNDRTGDPGRVILVPLYGNLSRPVTNISIRIPFASHTAAEIEKYNILTLCEVEVYKAIECQKYHLENGRVSVTSHGDNQQDFTYGATLTLFCLPGYQFPNNAVSATVTCNSNGIWSELKVCRDIDECNVRGHNACSYHGNCTNTAGSFSCECHSGYNGTTCETDIDECILTGPNACGDRGDCRNTIGSFSCVCHAGYTGPVCETDIDECILTGRNACNIHGDCINTIGSFSCICHSGFSGHICEAVITCPLPPTLPSNSVTSFTSGTGGSMSYNSTLTIGCRQGYQLNGTSSIRCTETGTWSDTNFGTCSGRTLTCFSCQDMTHLKYCNLVEQCQEDMGCYLEQFYVGEHVRYNSGCISQDNQVCDVVTSIAGQCTRCCNTSYCNSHGCGDSGFESREKRGPLCYDCQHLGDPSECLNIQECTEFEICHITEFQWGTHDRLYSMVCQPRHHCNSHSVPVNPDHIIVGRSIPTCNQCCAEDFCNLNCTSH